MSQELQLAPIDELIQEVGRRFNHFVFAGETRYL